MTGVLTASAIALALTAGAGAAGDWTPGQQPIVESLERLGASTRPGGGGPEAYAAVLAPGYTRWTMGDDEISGREEWTDGVRGWWNDGWRVVDSSAEILELTVHGDFATSRRIVRETYRGPEGEESGSRTALSETWVRGSNGEWLLLRVNARSLDP